MKNKLFLLGVLPLSIYVGAQVGINTPSPDATLDVVGFPANTAKLDGIIAPRLSGAELRAKNYGNSQKGAMVYVTEADTAPAGQTINVNNTGYYYFDGNSWVKQKGTDWGISGNPVNEIITSAETLGTAPQSANYLGTKGPDANLVLITADKVHAVLETSGTLSGGGETNSSINWGNKNTINGTGSNNIVLGNGNTVATNASDYPGIALGSGNIVAGGGKAIGVGNSTLLRNNFAFGVENQTGGPASVAIGMKNSTLNGGFAFGTSNNVGLNNFAFGNLNSAAGTQSMAIGIQAQANNGETVFANAKHAFLNSGNSATTVVGFNMLPTANSSSGASIQLKGVARTAGEACTSAEEGSIRYNSSSSVHEGCNGKNWKALY
ncbi:MAG: hypothetical protein LBE92_17575 [Chryseobacterium sp.]|uniref:hypothetical protein n=1 Tax=Chryseobacterium sp. TaxID=1871047 RepID=UPI00283A3545|nr:hypothetical protein [Chryseobacterium sp.]MDR2237938.1 hypothetical protein [Chryseobacterium sp.]